MRSKATAWIAAREGRWLEVDWACDSGTLMRPHMQPGRAPILEDPRRRAIDLNACEVRTLQIDDDYIVLQVNGHRWTLRDLGHGTGGHLAPI
jgi:hypothetical protein